MQQILEFISHHYWLWGLFSVLLGLVLSGELKRFLGPIKSVNPTELVRLINHEQGLVLDLRPKEAFEKGHIAGSQHMTIEDLRKPGQLKRFRQRPVVLLSDQEGHALKVGAFLMKEELRAVYRLQGGFRAWTGASLPVEN